MIVGQNEGSYVLRLSQSALFKRLTGQVHYYRADDHDMVIAVETNRRTPDGDQRVFSLDKLTPSVLTESDLRALFTHKLDAIELAHGAYWNSRLWC